MEDPSPGPPCSQGRGGSEAWEQEQPWLPEPHLPVGLRTAGAGAWPQSSLGGPSPPWAAPPQAPWLYMAMCCSTCRILPSTLHQAKPFGAQPDPRELVPAFHLQSQANWQGAPGPWAENGIWQVSGWERPVEPELGGGLRLCQSSLIHNCVWRLMVTQLPRPPSSCLPAPTRPAGSPPTCPGPLPTHLSQRSPVTAVLQAQRPASQGFTTPAGSQSHCGLLGKKSKQLRETLRPHPYGKCSPVGARNCRVSPTATPPSPIHALVPSMPVCLGLGCLYGQQEGPVQPGS